MNDPVVWAAVADKYLPAERTAEFLAAAARTRWVPADAQHPMSPGLAVKYAVVGMGMTGVREVGYSEAWEADDTTYAAPTGLEHPDRVGTYLILAARNSGVQAFFLDLGTGVCPVVLIDRP